ncbi:MAG TPA: hypothetical protein VMU64_14410 [Acidimicrobiales bacterium]|nr:hypothetical protein [Acidimicrobiales bacterium]
MPILSRSAVKAHIFRHVRLGVSLAVVGFGLVDLGSPVGASPAPTPVASVGTPLPSGWEACVLEGVGASVTPNAVADLDEWQLVEGGSTNNTAAFNPFNAFQVTDSSGAPIPAVTSANGFPAFGTWADGCAATVAALLQPIMEPIVTALRAGGVSVPGIFLFDVDQSPWCAPSADGIPCYASEILAGEIVETLLKGSSVQLKGSLTSYSNTGADLHTYEKAAYVTASDLGLVATKNALLTEAQQGVAVARDSLSTATRSLRRLALEDYTSGAASRFESSLVLLGSPDEQDAVGQYLLTIVASRLTDNYDGAESAFKTSVTKRNAAQASVAQATSLLDAAEAAENQALSGLETDAKNIEAGFACTAPQVTTAVASPVDDQGSAGQLWQALQDCLAPPLS